MRRVLLAIAGLGLIGASLVPNGLSAAGSHTQVDDYVLVTTVTPTPTPKILFSFPNQRSGTPTPTPKTLTH
jgi:hypothetical protein